MVFRVQHLVELATERKREREKARERVCACLRYIYIEREREEVVFDVAHQLVHLRGVRVWGGVFSVEGLALSRKAQVDN